MWGQMATGGGHTPLKETMSALRVPVMNSFSKQRDREWWTKRLQQVILEAGKEKKRLLQERNNYHQGVPAITVLLWMVGGANDHYYSSIQPQLNIMINRVYGRK